MPQAQSQTTTQTDIKYPSRYKVIFHNDNFTPVEFVVSLLVEIFDHTLEQATETTMTIHNQGAAVAGTYFYEVAEQKATDASTTAKINGHPLKITLDPA